MSSTTTVRTNCPSCGDQVEIGGNCVALGGCSCGAIFPGTVVQGPIVVSVMAADLDLSAGQFMFAGYMPGAKAQAEEPEDKHAKAVDDLIAKGYRVIKTSGRICAQLVLNKVGEQKWITDHDLITKGISEAFYDADPNWRPE